MAGRDEVKIEGRSVAVTGAGGFIGGAVCRRLIAEGARVRGIDLATAAERVAETGAEPTVADVTSPAEVERSLDGVELLVHAAAIVSDAGAMADHVRVNVGGTANVLRAGREAGLERVLHVSSVVVYGYDDASEQDEDAPRRVCGIPYIDTKSSSDRLACRGGAVVIRPGDVYGAGSIPWTARVAELLRSGQGGVPSGGDGIMLPVYIDDLIEAILLGLRRGEPGRPYTAWSGERVTFGEYFDSFAAMLGAGRVRRLPRPAMAAAGLAMEKIASIRGVPPPFTRHAPVLVDRRGTVSNGRIREELGWEPKVGLDEGLRRSEEWLRAAGLA